MAIERTAINNGDISELYTKLSTYANPTMADGKFFKSVSISGNQITCTDWADDVVFVVLKTNSSTWSYRAPNYSSNAFITTSAVKNMPESPLSSHPVAVYTVGKSAFCIELAYGSENNHIGLVVVGRASNNDTASFYPLLNANTSNAPDSYSVYSKSIEIPYRNGSAAVSIEQRVAYGGSPADTLSYIVKAFSIGTQELEISMNTVYVARTIQNGLYGKTRIVNGAESGRFLTNGLVFVKDDGD